jgi:hypothetical protein
MRRPFDGGWGAPEWPEPKPFPKLKKGRQHFMVALRLEPSGDLVAFADAFARAKNTPIVNTPDPDDRSMVGTFECTAKSAMQAIGICEFRVRRVLRKSGHEVIRASYDAVPAAALIHKEAPDA